MRVIAVMNQKGGVGKTTTALNLAHAFALSGHRVTAIDLDPQAQLTASFGVQGSPGGVDDVLLDGMPIEANLQNVREGIRLLPAGPRLGKVEALAAGGSKRGYLLREALQRLGNDDDQLVIDCPPSAGILGMNALLAADDIIIPVPGDYLALHGLSKLMTVLKQLEQSQERALRKWILLTRFQERRRLAREVRDKLLDYFPGQVLATTVREAVALSESPSFGKSIFEYRPSTRSAQEYRDVAADFLQGRTQVKPDHEVSYEKQGQA